MGKPDGKRKAASSGKDGQATPSKRTPASQDSVSVDSRLDKIVSAIEHLTEKVDQLESMVHLSDPSAISDSVSQGDKATSSARNMVSLASPNATTDSHTLSDLRMLDSLNAHVDNVMGRKAIRKMSQRSSCRILEVSMHLNFPEIIPKVESKLIRCGRINMHLSQASVQVSFTEK